MVIVEDAELCHQCKNNVTVDVFSLNKSKGELKKKQQLFWPCSGAVQHGLVLSVWPEGDVSLFLSFPLTTSLLVPHSPSQSQVSIQEVTTS